MRKVLSLLALAAALAWSLDAFPQTVNPSSSAGSGGGSGTVTSIATACGLAGGPITTSGTLTSQVASNPQSGSSYSFLLTDCGALVSFSNSGAVAATLTTSLFSTGNFLNAVNSSTTGVVTITPSSGTICGGSTLVLQPKQGVGIAFDGTNWQCSGGPSLASGMISGDGTVTAAGALTVTKTNGVAFATLATQSVTGTPSASTFLRGDYSWASPSGGTFPGYINNAGTWYANPYVQVVATSAVGNTNTIYCTIRWIYQPLHVEAFGIRVVTGSAGNNLAAALYTDLLTTGNVHRPGTLIDFTGTAFITTTGPAVVSAALANGNDAITTPGLYWDCIWKADATATYSAMSSGSSAVAAAIGSQTLSSVGNSTFVTSVSTPGGTFNSWSNFNSSTTWTEQSTSVFAPNMGLEVFSVP